MIDIFIVTYKPDFELMRAQFDSITKQKSNCGVFNLYIWDNSEDESIAEKLNQLSFEFGRTFSVSRVLAGASNLGFGLGNNRLMDISFSPWILILNQEVMLEPECIKKVMSFASADKDGCAWELRQIPYEHPKMYDPVTLETPWVSCAACLFKRSALREIKGFEPQIFMYGEDVDLSWRLRAKGLKLRYVPQAAVVHNTYLHAGEIKPLQIVEGTLTNLCLRARFGSWRDIIKGIILLLGEITLPESFPGRRSSFAKIFLRFAKRFHYFRRGIDFRKKGFMPTFIGWDYAIHRDGAFYRFNRCDKTGKYPLVSILVRTCNRPNWLRETLLSIKHQTYPNIEVFVVEDGAPSAERMVLEEFTPVMNLQYYSTGAKVGRSRAGNIALAKANGEWLNFLDDDDVLFADHVEVLLQAAIEQNVKGVYALTWETTTHMISEDPLKYKELSYKIRHRQPFCRITLWHKNYMPIQSVLFNRRLYETYGGLEEDMARLEDWNLWTRYTLEDDFGFVEKSTSKYRVTAKFNLQNMRMEGLDRGYRIAMEKQREMQILFRSNPRTISELIEAYLRSQVVLMVTRGQIRSYAEKFAVTRWLFRMRWQFRNVWEGLKKRLSF